MLETLILLALAFPIMSIVGLIMAGNTRERLRGLELKLKALEQKVATLSAQGVPRGVSQPPLQSMPQPTPPPAVAASPASVPPVLQPTEPIAAEPAPEVFPTPPSSPPVLPAPVQARPSLEERFGTQWVVWVG